MIKKTYKEVKEIVESQGSLLLSSEYINSQTPLKLKCLWGGFEGFIDRTIRDSIKNIYCRNNKINLIRIPYFKFKEIENIILNKLNQDNTEVTKGIKEPLAP